MTPRLTLLLCGLALLCLGSLASAQPASRVVSGYVEDLRNGEKLIGVNVFVPSLKIGTVTNTYGFYSLSLPADEAAEVYYSYIGYATKVQQLAPGADIKISLALSPELALETVEVTAERRIERETQMSVAEIPIRQIRKVPALLGEVDVLRVLQLLPGVQSGGEGQSGFYVRGGSPDQNLILLDGVPVYNASHLFGFFSVFNSEAIKDVKLIKGGFPARYGGRLSSVLEINMKEGNTQKLTGNASIGLVASKFTLEGPINKGRTSFLLSGRRTYIDLLARPFIRRSFRDNNSEGSVGYYFYDLNAKVNHRISDRDRVYLSVYTGRDRFYFNEEYSNTFDNRTVTDKSDSGLGWGNVTAALRWNRELSNKLFANTSVTYSRYDLGTDIRFGYEARVGGQLTEKDDIGVTYTAGIRDYAVKVDFDYLPRPNHFVRFGASAIYHQFEPGLFRLQQENSRDSVKFNQQLGQKDIFAMEYAVYVEDDFVLTPTTRVNAGLHLSGFSVSDKLYASLQPRLSINQSLPNEVALKASFATMRQYINLLAFEGIGLPTDLWLPTTERIKPQDAWQVAIGAAKTFEGYEISLEAYYKEMSNLIAYKDGEGIFDLKDWQDRVTQGDGDAYGLELFVQKKKGRLSGWVGYTLSWTNRQFADINNGQKFPFRYDRRHDISIVGIYEFSERFNFAATWVYGTGNAVTLANSTYQGSSPWNQLETYGSRNGYRMRPYHRLDVGVNFVKKRTKYTRTWSWGAYNAYINNNPFFVYFDTEYDSNTNESKRVLKQVTLFPIIPYFSYNIDF